MSDLYTMLIEMSKEHRKIRGSDGKFLGYTDTFHFDLVNKTISNGELDIVLNGELMLDEITLVCGKTYSVPKIFIKKFFDDFYVTLEDLYCNYITSVPTKHSNTKRAVFKAMCSDDLTLNQIAENEKRTTARYRLEAYILLCGLSGMVKWENQNNFFWKSKRSKGLVVLKEWVR